MLDNDSVTDQSSSVEPVMAPVENSADDLPRPPRGRRSATRPAGPPKDPVPAAADPAPANAATQAADDAQPQVTVGLTQPVEVATPVNPAEVPASQEATVSSALANETVSSVLASESVSASPPAPVSEQAEASAAKPATRSRSRRASKSVTNSAEPAASAETIETASETPAPKTPARRRSTRARKAAEQEAAGEVSAPSPEIEAALVAVESVSPKRSRRAARSAAADLIGDQVPTKADGEIDTQQVLASLAAAIAGRVEPVAAATVANADEDLVDDDQAADQPLAEPDAEHIAELPAAAPDNPEPATEESADAADQTAADDDSDSDETDDDAAEQTGGSAARRRRRRGGRRRRRGSSAGDEVDEQTDADPEPDSPDEQQDDTAVAASADEPGSSSSGRRRRRRRRRGEDAGDDEPDDVVVRVREPRKSAADEISGIEGSTRLEAKKQRRREGRAAGRHRAPILTEAEFLARRESVDRVMLVRQRDDYTQLAVLEDEVLVEHYVDRTSSTSLIGNIYLGRVQNVLPSMEAVFIDIGRGRNAVLYAGEVDWDGFDVSADARKVEQVFKSGQSVLVQVSKDPVGAKGARLTAHISIPGRYVVYSPGGHLSGISRKLPDAERQRLKQILDSVVAEESSVIVRTAAEGAATEELVQDVERLKAQWETIEKKSKQGSAPQQLYAEPDLTLRIIRDTFTEDFRQLIVAGHGGPDDAYDQIKAYLDHVAPQLADRLIEWDQSTGDPFAKFQIDEQISKALERKVFLPSGGSLVIDRTEAMTVIDVNTGKFTGSGGNLEQTVTRNNLEAAEEIVRQLRLRDLGGIIVIDFIDMVLPSNRELLLRRLVECLGRDRTRHQVSEVTSLGLVQMTRKRIGTGLAEAFTDVCEHCGGRGYQRHDDPVESQVPADGGERSGAKSSGNGGRRGRSANRTKKQDDSGKANQVQPSEAAKKAAARLAAAASRQHAEQTDHDGAAAQKSAAQQTETAETQPKRVAELLPATQLAELAPVSSADPEAEQAEQ